MLRHIFGVLCETDPGSLRSGPLLTDCADGDWIWKDSQELEVHEDNDKCGVVALQDYVLDQLSGQEGDKYNMYFNKYCHWLSIKPKSSKGFIIWL